jgi:hypothetical protein
MKPKRHNFGIEMKIVEGKSGDSYLVFRTREGAFHVFREVEAKDAAVDCGAMNKGNTRSMWKAVWEAN